MKELPRSSFRVGRALALGALLTFASLACSPCIRSPHWAIKTGADPQARAVSTALTPATIDALRAIPHADHDVEARIAPVELTTYVLRDVKLDSFQRPIDGDIHLVVLDDDGHTLIAEIPPPGCVDASSPWRDRIAAARALFDEEYPSGLVGDGHERLVSLVGVGFFDVRHLQPGVAPNAIELHPVLAMCFGKGCALPSEDARSPAAGPPPRSGGSTRVARGDTNCRR